MPGTALVREVFKRVTDLLEESPQWTRWGENELVNWLNDAQFAITKFAPQLCSRSDVVKLKPGTKQSIESIAASDIKPGDGSIGVAINGTSTLGIIRNMGSDGLTPGEAIRGPVSRKVMDTQTPTWHQVTGPAVKLWVFDPQTPRYFYVYPGVPSTGSVWVDMQFTARPVPIPNTGTPGAELYSFGGSNTTKISVDDELVEDLVNYVCARAHMKDAEYAIPAKATFFENLFLTSLNARLAAITGSNPNLKRLPLAPQPLAQASS